MAEVIKKATRESYGEALTELADKYPDLIAVSYTHLDVYKRQGLCY